MSLRQAIQWCVPCAGDVWRYSEVLLVHRLSLPIEVNMRFLPLVLVIVVLRVEIQAKQDSLTVRRAFAQPVGGELLVLNFATHPYNNDDAEYTEEMCQAHCKSVRK